MCSSLLHGLFLISSWLAICFSSFLFEVIPFTGARTLDGFVEFLEQSLKTPSTVSFLTFLPPNLSDFSTGFLVASWIEIRNWLDPLTNSFKFFLLGGRRGREGCSGQGWIIRCVGFESLLGKRVRVCCVAMFSLMYVINEHLKKNDKKIIVCFSLSLIIERGISLNKALKSFLSLKKISFYMNFFWYTWTVFIFFG